MSITPLSRINERIERSLFKAIDLEVVAKGYYPNRRQTITSAILNINTGTKAITLTGDYTAKLTKGVKIEISGHSLSDGIYTLTANSTLSGSDTIVVVKETIPDGTTEGNVLLKHFSDNAHGKGLLDAAVTAIIADKGFAIQVFNSNQPESLGEKAVPRIVLVPKRRLPGALGGSPTRQFEPLGLDPLHPDAYNKVILPPQSVEYEFDVHLVSQNSEQDRILHALVALGLPARGYVPFYDNDEDWLFLSQFSSRTIHSQLNVIEFAYLYKVDDIFETEALIERTGVPAISEITIDYELNEQDTTTPPTGDTDVIADS